MARITLADPEDLPLEKRPLLDSLSDADDPSVEHSLEGGTLNVYRALGRNLSILEGFREYGSTVWHGTDLAPVERELAILATSYHTGMAYEWHQHVRVALDEGIPPEPILAVSMDRLDELEPEQARLVEYVERYVADEVDDETHERLADHYAESTIVGIGMLVSLYAGLAHFLDALDVELEDTFVGWQLENL
ncbi:carboxymuconolactone decarboxylase family protein [Halanaeroarchaeum sulfurireducens]|uniref:Carboxymuconolactone decarboxylase n=1 Tax=Halanaeroarchaeum sulfurireducens TaxID=1604004 RepID=A0A0F7PBC2_9EURY|nr:carboxymuconolactone decarboxylase family protein [Halanaeroarchaeum sulfurireducens]AKH96939.1 carboxymuconolactone decarboxylase [Halanaeroarchaeum sulfurireducens]ALG81340.1 carboxymuconolactone decarboxylase [Halanaeroarchaeum sulfurireducens]